MATDYNDLSDVLAARSAGMREAVISGLALLLIGSLLVHVCIPTDSWGPDGPDVSEELLWYSMAAQGIVYIGAAIGGVLQGRHRYRVYLKKCTERRKKALS